MEKINILWFRRDLRIHDQAALYHALKEGIPVLPIFIFDKNILDELEPADTRVLFIHRTLQQLKESLRKLSTDIKIFHGTPSESFQKLMTEFDIQGIFTNHDYEPYAKDRDHEIQDLLSSKGISFKTFKDQVIFEKNEIIKDDGKPYTVFTPYSKKWKAALSNFPLKPYPTEPYFSNFIQVKNTFHFPSMKELGFNDQQTVFPLNIVADEVIRQYHLQRDIPGIEGTSRMSVHLRFGTVSIRQLATQALALNEKYLNELIWRDFYQSILWHFPQVVNHAFKPVYDEINWENDEQQFKAWCDGQTGYPIVDAGMRQLNQTGWMHNRVRMIVASFLTKHLLIDWRWGEAYFAKKLIDFDLASNNGGWQWAAGCGVDAAPYFRIFNPYLQTIKFDPNLTYIRQWVPEFEEFSYPKPIVDHKEAREKCLTRYAQALK
jgi:deoxyribodipyrimidine photo-lyase